VRQAWADLLLPLLPPAPASAVDLGCDTGSLTAADCVALLGEGDVRPLTDPALWGREITDERYLVLAR
jgi:hypothetical protein